ncbi:MAG: CRISPR-associated endonuclease Cas2 [Candidatus Harrisonbacteria bacterium RIFOXYA1_FULL_48_8]|uniref:CRISPR-associated endonuclease Cas2 n=2 Tax=Candidatus Harrisoniibacteriota TaxID=1817905 RepID=A0A1G1ZWV0_9BACT|nr:MAG: CRISPR-associated endonuclease Cas2 [Candidatus Harrisonbacteria bacterium RIFCSPHIGHO2_12_FULL_48_16]OGY69044.1 MAG: CRISPR-associated endonuclease Cas2 [Candidatus Harrisonbacteria bacterium RIFOXYA1_FULL_48_8]
MGGGFLLVSGISPLGGAQIIKGLVNDYFRKKRFERERFLRDLKRLQSRDLLDYRESPDGKIKITLTKSGRKKILSYNIDDIKLNTQKRWDGLWRMVTFDIPHHQKKARDAFRQKLRQLGFYAIQKSVFITPYECENEIDFVCSIFKIRHHILIFNIKNFEGEEKFRHYFKV